MLRPVSWILIESLYCDWIFQRMGLRGVLLTMEVAGLIQEMEQHFLLAQFSVSQCVFFFFYFISSLWHLFTNYYLWTIRTLCLLAANVLQVLKAMDSPVKVRRLLKNLVLNIYLFFINQFCNYFILIWLCCRYQWM